MIGRTLIGPPRLVSAGFLRSEVSTKNTMARFPAFFDLSSVEQNMTYELFAAPVDQRQCAM